ncbi:MAG: trifunctional transcriptional activator/DNA repair protein Ada/methylated-DNA--[protein]-cysteine S-methyltransferase [Rhodothermales bacterium]
MRQLQVVGTTPEQFEEYYAALVSRDERYEGKVFVGVTTTGIFCRMTCPARKPNRENCTFFPSVSDCLEAGFRPCKRCSPLKPAAETDPMITRLLQQLESDPTRRWSEEDVAQLGYDPSTVRRIFKRQYGRTFLELARMTRIRGGFDALGGRSSVIEAQLESGFDSGSGFRSAFAKLLGVAPDALRRDGLLRADWVDTPLGNMVVVSDKSSVHLLEFADRRALPTELRKLHAALKGDIGIGRFDPADQLATELDSYFKGESASFETQLTFWGSDFTKAVWRELRKIAPGETRSYSDIARRIRRPSAVRAVARANGANQIAIAIPCHRVIGADGSLTGYGGGLWRKQKLIELERSLADNPAGKSQRMDITSRH